MEPEGLLPRLQEPTTCPYPEPDQSSPCPPSHFLNIYLNIITINVMISKYNKNQTQANMFINHLPQNSLPRTNTLITALIQTFTTLWENSPSVLVFNCAILLI